MSNKPQYITHAPLEIIPGEDIYIFGYGSLTWKPSEDLKGCLSYTGLLTDGFADSDSDSDRSDVNVDYGQYYTRVWSQRSTDHRGSDSTQPGVVCDLLKHHEISEFYSQWHSNTDVKGRGDEVLAATKPPTKKQAGVIGTLYLLPSATASLAIAELDVREKGGYNRELLYITIPALNKQVKALLYRGSTMGGGTSFFWGRMMFPSLYSHVYEAGSSSSSSSDSDSKLFSNGSSKTVRHKSLKVAVAASAIGPSGPNHVYLENLAVWLESQSTSTTSLSSASAAASTTSTTSLLPMDAETIAFARDVKTFMSASSGGSVLFFSGAGSNQFSQLGIIVNEDANDSNRGENGCEICPAHSPNTDIVCNGLWETFLFIPPPPSHSHSRTTATTDSTDTTDDELKPVKQAIVRKLEGGGGHSAALLDDGRVVLWGDNTDKQCSGNTSSSLKVDSDSVEVYVHECNGDESDSEDDGFVDVSMGQSHTLLLSASGAVTTFGDNSYSQCVVPTHIFKFTSISAGIRNSGGITDNGEVVIWGDLKYTPSPVFSSDGVKFKKIALGWRNAVLLDDDNRIWSWGDNKYGQLGLGSDSGKSEKSPVLLDASSQPMIEREGIDIVDVDVVCGWSHTLILLKYKDKVGEEVIKSEVWGWGRNDKGQLSLGLNLANSNIQKPTLLFTTAPHPSTAPIHKIKATPEGLILLTTTGEVYGCGWNEHGNLGTGDVVDRGGLTVIEGYGGVVRGGVREIAGGGGHCLVW